MNVYTIHYGQHEYSNTAPETYTNKRVAIAAAREYAEAYGWTINKICVDDGEGRTIFAMHLMRGHQWQGVTV